MIDPRSLLAARSGKAIRYALLADRSGDLARVLSGFGLKADASLLVEHDRETALTIVKALLWKDMAYQNECMPEAQAEMLARQLIDEHGKPGCRFFSNGNWARRESWNPLTDSTFDAGIVIFGENGCHYCIWFQDED